MLGCTTNSSRKQRGRVQSFHEAACKAVLAQGLFGLVGLEQGFDQITVDPANQDNAGIPSNDPGARR